MPADVAIVEERNRVLRIQPPRLGEGWTDVGVFQPTDHMLSLVRNRKPTAAELRKAFPKATAETLREGFGDVNPFDWGRAGELRETYGSLVDGGRLAAKDQRSAKREMETVLRRMRAWRLDGTAATLLAAATKGQDGVIDRRLGPLLERVRIVEEGVVEVPDLAALAAWTLHNAIVRRNYELRTCEFCGHPFLATERSRYCRRRAQGLHKQSCQDVAKVKDYRAKRKSKEEN